MMGEYAAMAIAREIGWSYADALDMLYGGRKANDEAKPKRPKVKCPICPTSFKTASGAFRHAQNTHKKAQYQGRIADFAAQHNLIAPKDGGK